MPDPDNMNTEYPASGPLPISSTQTGSSVWGGWNSLPDSAVPLITF